jgi:hypothetical protein
MKEALAMRMIVVVGLGGLLFLTGCSGSKPASNNDEAAEARSDAALLEPFYLKEKPAEAQSVIGVRTGAKDGDEVVLQGIVPPDNVKPYSDTLAIFKLMAKEDLDDPKVKEEFDCDDAAT